MNLERIIKESVREVIAIEKISKSLKLENTIKVCNYIISEINSVLKNPDTEYGKEYQEKGQNMSYVDIIEDTVAGNINNITTAIKKDLLELYV